MSRAAQVAIAAAVCALTLGVPDTASVRSAQAAAPAGSAVLAPGWARVVVSGTLASAVPAAGIVSVSLNGASRADVFEGGTSWHSRPLSGTRLIHLLPQTVMIDSAARPIAAAAPHAGDRVAVWGVMAPGDEIMALSLVLATPRAAPPAQPPVPGHVMGVVTGRAGATLDLVADTGVRHAVVLTGTTQIKVPGAAAAAAVGPFDVLEIEGAVNSDGSLVATHVNVEFLSSQGTQVSGPIESLEGAIDGLVVGETMVCTSTQTYFLRGTSRLWIAQMSVGRPVTVYGVPILAGKTPIGLAAKVVAVR
jgi:Domain of unknown function (DUF5666)